MARKMQWKESEWSHWHAMRLMSIGVLLVIAGLLLRFGYSWDVVLIVVGVLIFLKGLAKKFMKM